MSQTTVSIPVKTEVRYVTPYPGKDAEVEIRAWRASGKPVFIKAYEQVEGECKNCQGHEFVFVNFIDSGPYKFVPSGVATWYDGDGRFGQGWYKVERTEAYACEECKR